MSYLLFVLYCNRKGVILLATLGEQIKELRKNRHINQQQLADAVGVTKASISDYERNKRMPKIDTIRIIAETLDVPESELFQHLTDQEDDGYIQMEYPIGSNYPKIMQKMMAALNKLSDEARIIAVDRIEELCMIPMYKRTLANVLLYYISKRYQLSYNLWKDTGLQELPFNNGNWKLLHNIQHIILQREINSATKKIWEFLYYSCDGDYSSDFDIRLVFDNLVPQCDPVDNLGFVFDDSFILHKFYDYYVQHNDYIGSNGKKQKYNSQAIFLHVERDTWDIQDVIEYDPNR